MEDIEFMVLVVEQSSLCHQVDRLKRVQCLDRVTSNAFQGCKKERKMITNLKNPMTFNPMTLGV